MDREVTTKPEPQSGRTLAGHRGEGKTQGEGTAEEGTRA